MNFSNNIKSYLEYKRNLALELGLKVSKIKSKYSGYNNAYTGYGFRVGNSDEAFKYYEMSFKESIDLLTKEDLILWYLDDGSFHKKRKTMHLYSNMLNKEETLFLIDKIDKMFNIDPRLRIDKKKDGRQYYYLYFRRAMVKVFKPMVLDFLEENNIMDLMYKVDR